MKPTLDEQDISVYASDAQTIQEPQGSDYSVGVTVGKTIPAKWWNWLFRAATSRLHQAFNDITNIFTELKNLVLDAGLTPSASSNTQIAQAIVKKTDVQLPLYISKEKQRFARQWEAYQYAGYGDRDDYTGNSVAGEKIGAYLFAGSTLAGHYMCSLDGVNWRKINIDALQGAQYTSCYCNGYYIGIYTSSSTYTLTSYWCRVRVYVGLDIHSMEIVYENGFEMNESMYESTYPVMLTYTVLDRYVVICTPYEENVLFVYLSDYGISSVTCTPYAGAQFEFWRNATLPPIHSSFRQYIGKELPNVYEDGDYIFGCVKLHNGTLVNLAPDTANLQINTHAPRKLKSGNIVFIPLVSGVNSYVMDTNGNVTISATNYMLFQSQPYLYDCVLALGSAADTIAYSYDGVNFTDLPFTLRTDYTRHAIVQDADAHKYFILPRGPAPDYIPGSVREIDDNLSASSEDYYNTNVSPDDENGRGPMIHVAGYNKLVCRGHSSGSGVGPYAGIVYDYSQRTTGYANYFTYFADIVLIAGMFLPLYDSYWRLFGSYEAFRRPIRTSLGENKVEKYTLYLR